VEGASKSSKVAEEFLEKLGQLRAIRLNPANVVPN